MTSRTLSVSSALAVTRGGLREVVKRLARLDSNALPTRIRWEAETIRYLADLLDTALANVDPNTPDAASAVPNALAADEGR